MVEVVERQPATFENVNKNKKFINHEPEFSLSEMVSNENNSNEMDVAAEDINSLIQKKRKNISKD